MPFREEWIDDVDMCRTCGQSANPVDEQIVCEFCDKPLSSGRTHYTCESCGSEWIIGRHSFRRNQLAACEQCSAQIVNNCDACNEPVSGANAWSVDGLIVCRRCFDKEEQIWCPCCIRSFPYSGYLRFAFWDDRPGFHAAALVTHYRHEHGVSHDRAWRSRQYASKILGYEYDEYKERQNEQAKRQLLRAIAKLVESEAYPASAPIGALDLVRAFDRLMSNDDATDKLIHDTIAKLQR